MGIYKKQKKMKMTVLAALAVATVESKCKFLHMTVYKDQACKTIDEEESKKLNTEYTEDHIDELEGCKVRVKNQLSTKITCEEKTMTSETFFNGDCSGTAEDDQSFTYKLD